MTSLCEEYILSNSVDGALQALYAAQGSARILAGGSDLLLELQQGIHPPVRLLVDVTEIPDLRALEVRRDALFIGAAVTLARLASSSLLKTHAQALADAAALMANPQVCNVATIGGNVAHALPAADGTIALLALGAQAEIAALGGRRVVPLKVLFKGPGESALDPCHELLVGFYLPLRAPGQASAFTRRVNPQGIALALLNVAVWLQRAGERIEDIRIAVGPSGPVPKRMTAAEEIYRRQIPSPDIHGRAIEALLPGAHFRTSLHRATAEYRRHLVGVLLGEAFLKAWERAGKAGEP
jgi:carbon-monoxide dehydrogenase medium subunit